MSDAPEEMEDPTVATEESTGWEELTLFGGYEPPDPFEHWVGMPEYKHEDLSPWRSYPIHFRSEEDLDAFCKLLGLEARPSKAFWYPPDPIGRTSGKVYKTPEEEQ
jgi:hypothetical protein